eukprot:CAMPEP_0114541866 /NCGR_PEP_ID=MMETSP0114-20121206/1533_1 /TAXON_ID=31324 /ORGANISM="Goniomonas sp, Strain m" /LENGTH=528 /DNA_ID=CAMNT_0001726131 /DNA_START=98 /DNA_END=1684 /DNA_ORIENTATION=-
MATLPKILQAAEGFLVENHAGSGIAFLRYALEATALCLALAFLVKLPLWLDGNLSLSTFHLFSTLIGALICASAACGAGLWLLRPNIPCDWRLLVTPPYHLYWISVFGCAVYFSTTVAMKLEGSLTTEWIWLFVPVWFVTGLPFSLFFRCLREIPHRYQDPEGRQLVRLTESEEEEEEGHAPPERHPPIAPDHSIATKILFVNGMLLIFFEALLCARLQFGSHIVTISWLFSPLFFLLVLAALRVLRCPREENNQPTVDIEQPADGPLAIGDGTQEAPAPPAGTANANGVQLGRAQGQLMHEILGRWLRPGEQLAQPAQNQTAEPSARAMGHAGGVPPPAAGHVASPTATTTPGGQAAVMWPPVPAVGPGGAYVGSHGLGGRAGVGRAGGLGARNLSMLLGAGAGQQNAAQMLQNTQGLAALLAQMEHWILMERAGELAASQGAGNPATATATATGGRGATQAYLNSLPVFAFTQAMGPKDNNMCAICLDTYEEGQQLRTLPCFHMFHCECFDVWARRDRSCPICKLD